MRVTNAPASRKRRKRTTTATKGFRMRRSKLFRYAKDALDHGKQYSYRDRKNKKRTFRALWQIRINAAAREAGMSYSRFMNGLKTAKVALNRKMLADIAATDSATFLEIVKISQNAVESKSVFERWPIPVRRDEVSISRWDRSGRRVFAGARTANQPPNVVGHPSTDSSIGTHASKSSSHTMPSSQTTGVPSRQRLRAPSGKQPSWPLQ